MSSSEPGSENTIVWDLCHILRRAGTLETISVLGLTEILWRLGIFRIGKIISRFRKPCKIFPSRRNVCQRLVLPRVQNCSQNTITMNGIAIASQLRWLSPIPPSHRVLQGPEIEHRRRVAVQETQGIYLQNNTETPKSVQHREKTQHLCLQF